jgi:hypothetical protein
MKEFVRYASRQWHELTEADKLPYQLMGEVEKTRYERDKQSFVTGGVEGPLDLQLKQQQTDLAIKLSSYKPKILVGNIELMKSEVTARDL